MTTAIVWFRQDLRLLDNRALRAALDEADEVLPLYVLADGEGGAALGGAAKWWLHHSLAALSASIAARGGVLTLRAGDAAVEVARFARETGAEIVHVHACPEPHWRTADAALETALDKIGCRLVIHSGGVRMYDGYVPRTKTGKIFNIYTPYANAARAMAEPAPPIAEPAVIPHRQRPRSDALESCDLLPTRPDWSGGLRAAWVPGEEAGRARGREFLKHHAAGYDTGRNLPGQDFTSRLSPYLHWGEVSANALWHALHRHAVNDGERAYASELIWREFAAYMLQHYPHMPDRPLRPAFENLPWRDDRAALRAWQRGRTGVPIVDAGMRQLWQTGWMHNRVRMIVASFLVKHLLIDWRHGAAWFMDTLVDADLASNSANWQWVSGTGLDSQPFFRVFNPLFQGEKYDEAGDYVREFVPELARVPAKYIHAPWSAPEPVLREAGITLGENYPAPLIDLAEGRQRALAVYRQHVRVEGDVA